MTNLDKVLVFAFLILWFLLGGLMYEHVIDGQTCATSRAVVCGIFGLYFAYRCIRTYIKEKKFLPRHFIFVLLCFFMVVFELCFRSPYH